MEMIKEPGIGEGVKVGSDIDNAVDQLGQEKALDDSKQILGSDNTAFFADMVEKLKALSGDDKKDNESFEDMLKGAKTEISGKLGQLSINRADWDNMKDFEKITEMKRVLDDSKNLSAYLNNYAKIIEGNINTAVGSPTSGAKVAFMLREVAEEFKANLDQDIADLKSISDASEGLNTSLVGTYAFGALKNFEEIKKTLEQKSEK